MSNSPDCLPQQDILQTKRSAGYEIGQNSWPAYLKVYACVMMYEFDIVDGPRTGRLNVHASPCSVESRESGE
jgi:hypothetical protein